MMLQGPRGRSGKGPLADLPIVRTLFLGDSLTKEALYRRAVDRFVRTEAHHIQFVGDLGLDAVTGGIIGSPDLTSWAHSGIGGQYTYQIRARIPGIAAALASPPDIIVLGMGTNDVSLQRPLADMQADFVGTLKDLRATWPNAYIILNSLPTWRSGSASGANWADDLALRNALVASLPAIARPFGSRVRFVDGYAGQPPQEISSDGVHPIEDGYRRPAAAIADAILELVGVRRRRRRPLVPQPRPAQSCILVNTPSTAKVNWTGGNLAWWPESGHFALHAIVRFVDTPAGVYGVFGATDLSSYASGWGVVRYDNGISFYFGSSDDIWAGSLGYPAGYIQAGVDYHIAIVCDRAANRIGMAINGLTIFHSMDLVANGHPSANWSFPASQQLWIGRWINQSANFRIKELAFYKGANCPRIEDLNRFAEQTYVDGVLWPNALTALYLFREGSGAVNEATGATGTGALSGGAAWDTW